MTASSAEEPGKGPLPLAMAAVTVAGQCRERSPADLAIFGSGATRFSDRFVEPQRGEAVLAEALSDGVAEASAELRTGTGTAPFRVALWRQRGGDRIRLLASFVHAPPAPREVGEAAAVHPGAVERFSSAIRPALYAATELAERIRTGAPPEAGEIARQAGDLLAATWRMSRLVDDLELLGALGTTSPPLRMGEVDLLRLVRRVVRLAEPLASASGVAISLEAGSEPLPGVVADETTLWTLLEGLIGTLVAPAGGGGELTVRLRVLADLGDLEMVLQRRGKGGRAVEPLPPLLAELAVANGARLEQEAAEAGPLARLTFPKRRCLSPL